LIRLRHVAARNFTRWGLCAALLVAFCGFSRSAAAQGPPYTFVKLQVPGSVYTDATGVNNAGHVVGSYYSADGVRRGYMFDGSTYTSVDFPGASHTFLFGIGASGRTVGSYTMVPNGGGGQWHSLIEDGGNFTGYDVPNHESDGRAINASGQIVGIYDSGPGTTNVSYLKVGETYTDIMIPASLHTYAFGINDAGKISGSYAGADNALHGFLKTGANVGIINFPSANQTFVGGLNNLDAMVGWSQRGANAPIGFVRTGLRLRAFDVNLPGATAGQPQALNDVGQVVGNYNGTADCPQGCAFLATPRTDVPPSCDQAMSMQYGAGTLKMKFTGFRTTMPFTWTMVVYALNTQVTLWSAPIAAISPALAFDVPVTFPSVGPVIGLSTLSRASGDVICADFATVNTGG
jgi:hypothetical protein